MAHLGNRGNLDKLRDLVKKHQDSRIYNYIDDLDWKINFINDYNEEMETSKANNTTDDFYMKFRLNKLNNQWRYDATNRTFEILTSTVSSRMSAVFESLCVLFKSNIISRRMSVYMNGPQKPELTIETHTMFPDVSGEFLPLYWSTFSEIKFVIYDIDEDDIVDFYITYGCIGSNYMMEVHNDKLLQCDWKFNEDAFNLGVDPLIHKWKVNEDSDPLNVLYSDQALVLVNNETANNVISEYTDEQTRQKVKKDMEGITFTVPIQSEFSSVEMLT